MPRAAVQSPTPPNRFAIHAPDLPAFNLQLQNKTVHWDPVWQLPENSVTIEYKTIAEDEHGAYEVFLLSPAQPVLRPGSFLVYSLQEFNEAIQELG